MLRPIDGRTIALLGKEMGRDWYLCGIYLGIRNASLQSIQDRNTRSLETMSVEMLEQWKKMKGDCASSEELHDAFVKLGRRDLAGACTMRSTDHDVASLYRTGGMRACDRK